MKSLLVFFKDIKIEHTVFALPFAVTSAFIASDELPAGNLFFWIVVAMVGARSWAMAFNRFADADYDRKNVRTKGRAIPSGSMSRSMMLAYGIAAVIVFEVAAYNLNRLAFILSPLALFVVSFYSYTKRFSFLSHFVLGLSLGIAPVGAWVAVKGEISLISIILGAAVMLWTAGFDILYSLQDVEFDKAHGLYSFPVRFGVHKSLVVSRLLHAGMILFLILLIPAAHLGVIFFCGIIASAVFLVYEHNLVKHDDISRINQAFFNMNGIVSILIMLFSITDVLF